MICITSKNCVLFNDKSGDFSALNPCGLRKNIWGDGCRDFTYSDGFTRRFMGISRGYMVIRTSKNCLNLRVNMLTHVDSMDKSDVLFSDKPISDPTKSTNFGCG